MLSTDAPSAVVSSLSLDSSVGEPIPNDQEAPRDDAEFVRWLESFRATWEPVGCRLRPHPMLRYNCHGLTFASRRTWIDDARLIPRLLDEDGFDEIDARDAEPGDIVVYFDTRGRADHSGLVVSNPGGLALLVPTVLSKWAKAHEVIHAANVCPYAQDGATIRYFRLTRSRTKPFERRRNLLLP